MKTYCYYILYLLYIFHLLVAVVCSHSLLDESQEREESLLLYQSDEFGIHNIIHQT